MLDPVHRYIKIIVADQYQSPPSLKSLTTEMVPSSVEFVSALVLWVDDTYESLLSGGNFKEVVLLITTRVIRSIFEDYMVPARANPHRRITLVLGVICCHLTE